ncbi:alginate export family protein [Reichenbachiella carrageenanivorans]|uniref:Alginate export family protein n=1 Tax=Reichenbachiella carrageenanivorans TaxID=2979869 RepID=A0ABY6D1Z2_9BACT|nr:alginate export family protein [Reichenbachiella carrageenanivorans]UXX79113.1 alginate export family protein [Reichenbachiella carrageenanivorans]
MKRLIPAISAILLLTLATAQAQFSLSGEVNARSEFRNGFKKPISENLDPAFFTEQRTRLYANYKTDEYEVNIALQDIRMWGADGIVDKTYGGSFGISEAWARYYMSQKLSFKFGRQMISYDNQRMFGGLEWAMQGLRHDAALLMYEDTLGLKIHAGVAYNQNPATGSEPVRLTGTYYPPFTGNGAYHATGNYKHMEFAYLNKEFDAGSLSVYLINDARQYGLEDSVANRQTYGLMGMKKLGSVSLNGEFFYQGGKFALSDLSAYMFSVSATMKTSATPLTLGYDHLSGQDPNSSKNTTFAPLFGTNHALYGFMDYFYVGNGNSNAGLQDLYLKTKFKLGKGALLGHVHYFMTASTVYETDGVTEASASLGTELDLVYVRPLGKVGTFKLGYSQMFANDTMDLIKGTPGSKSLNNWAWAQLVIKPKFL